MKQTDLMAVWGHACETDTSATKIDKSGGYDSTAINGYWMFRKATELWGPIGSGWGFDILADEFKDGAPIVDDQNNTICMSQMHTAKIRLWYGSRDIPGVLAYGHTPYIQNSRYGPYTDMEAPKKSITDALKKALSMLGFSADVYMGQFDDKEYVQSQQMKEFIEKADDKDKAIEDAQQELKDYVDSNLESVKTAVTVNEVNGIVRVSIRHLERQATLPDMKEIAERGIKAIAREGEKKKVAFTPVEETA